MTWKYTDEYYREYTRTTWNESAPVWKRYAHVLAPFRADLVRAAAARPGEKVLDIATGQGEPALTLAAQVSPTGQVTGVDLSEELIKIAKREAQERKVPNVRFDVMNAEELTLPDASFDLAVSAFGFQIITDPEKACREAFRVLKPGGRIAVTVWGPAEKCHAMQIIVGPMMDHAEPDETGYLPTPYELGGPHEMVKFLEAAGFRDAREERRSHDWVVPNEEAYFELVLQGTPLGHSLREEEPAVQEDVLRKTRANVKKWVQPDGRVAAPNEGVVATARKP